MLARTPNEGDTSMGQSLTIGQVAKTSGVAAKTIRYYEQIGVLPAPSRAPSGYRQYDLLSIERVRFVRRARTLGLPLRRLKTLSKTSTAAPRPAMRRQLLALVHEQLFAVRSKLAELEHLRDQLEEVSQRMLASPGGRHSGPCRCLESGNETTRQPRTRPRRASAE
jgi:DNA-binding transcriptional MerR regulator